MSLLEPAALPGGLGSHDSVAAVGAHENIDPQKQKPICAPTDDGATCVAAGTPEHDAVPDRLRFRCTHQRDCAAGDTCQLVFGESEHDFQTFYG